MNYAISVFGSLSALLVGVALSFLVICLSEWVADRRHRRRMAQRNEEE